MQIKRKKLAGLEIFGFLGRVVLSHPSEKEKPVGSGLGYLEFFVRL